MVEEKIMRTIKTFFLGIISCLIFSFLSCIDRPWHPGQTYTIPDDGYTYTLDWSFSLTDDLLISGTLKILALTDHVVALTNDGHQIAIEADGVLTLTAGWGANGTDGSGSHGVDGVDGKDVWLVNNGTITVDGTLTLTGGKGGDGGSASSSNNGGAGGSAGDTKLIGSGNIFVTSYGLLSLNGGASGNGGDGGPSGLDNIGGDGGGGGNVQASGTGSFFIESLGTFILKGGTGGNGGKAGGGIAENNGGSGGGGGIVTVEATFAAIDISMQATLTLQGGDSGRGGDGGGVESNSGIGGTGGDAEIKETTLSITNGFINLYGGNGGNGGSGSGSKGGNASSAGSAKIRSTINIVKSNNTTINLQGGDGGAAGSTPGGNGGNGGSAEIINDTNNIFFVIASMDSSITVNANDGLNNDGAGGITRLLFGISVRREDQPLYDPNLTLSQTLSIDYTWTITQNQNIWGNGNTIALGPNGEIVIDNDIMLLLDNLDIENVAENNIRCLNENAEINLNNVTWTQSANYTFTQGTLTIDGDCTINGAYTTFKVEDITKPVTILSGASLNFSTNTTFAYDTSPGNLIVLSSPTSILGLDNATLLATQDLTLQTGILSTNGLAIVQGTGTLSLVGLNDIVARGRIAAVGNVVW